MNSDPAVDWAAVLAFLSIAGFIAARWWVNDRSISRGEATKMCFIGASFPSAVLICVSPFNHDLLAHVVDKPVYLLPTGVLMVLYSLGDVFDWDT